MRPENRAAFLALAATLAFAACRGPDVGKPVPASVTAPTSDTIASQPPPSAQIAAAPQTALPPVLLAGVAPGALYVCVSATPGETRQTAIELSPQVAEVCRKAPEMGPCQYERETCRRSGGRVFAADGTEITREMEAGYDKRVLRIRMQAN